MVHDYMDSIVRPRLNDYHGILLLQDKVDFAIPFLDEDIPLYVDPFCCGNLHLKWITDCMILSYKISIIWDI